MSLSKAGIVIVFIACLLIAACNGGEKDKFFDRWRRAQGGGR